MYYQGKTILITGGTGSYGQALTRKLLKQSPKEIRIFSRNESSQVAMKHQFNSHPLIRYIIGDIRDLESLLEACQQVDIVFHMAAMKHVDLCEYQPLEALKTNVLGTQNVIQATIENGVDKVVNISTDKAGDPINIYGMSKAYAERLIIRANGAGIKTKLLCTRSGNVLGSNGSAIPIFKKQIEAGEEVTLTSEKMTRYFLTVEDAIDRVMKAGELAIGGETLVMKMKACRILDIIQVMGKKLSDRPLKIKNIGVRASEKLYEVLISKEETPYVYDFNEEFYLLLPSIPPQYLLTHYRQYKRLAAKRYTSEEPTMSAQKIEEMLQSTGVLP